VFFFGKFNSQNKAKVKEFQHRGTEKQGHRVDFDKKLDFSPKGESVKIFLSLRIDYH
jgi:hypothetical protein